MEIQFALEDERMELLGVRTIKCVRFSEFGFGFSGFHGGLDYKVKYFHKFLSFGWCRFFRSFIVHQINVYKVRRWVVCGCHWCGGCCYMGFEISCMATGTGQL